MTTAYISYGTETTTLSTELNSLANATGAASTTEISNTTNRFVEMELDVYLAAASATTSYVQVYVLEGTSTGNLATTAQLQNPRLIGTVQLNGATAVRKNFKFDSVSPYWKVYIYNASGVALAASGNTVKYTGKNLVDV